MFIAERFAGSVLDKERNQSHANTPHSGSISQSGQIPINGGLTGCLTEGAGGIGAWNVSSNYRELVGDIRSKRGPIYPNRNSIEKYSFEFGVDRNSTMDVCIDARVTFSGSVRNDGFPFLPFATHLPPRICRGAPGAGAKLLDNICYVLLSPQAGGNINSFLSPCFLSTKKNVSYLAACFRSFPI